MTCIISAFSELLAYNLLHMWLAKSCLPSKWFKLLVLHLALNLEGKKKSPNRNLLLINFIIVKMFKNISPIFNLVCGVSE